MTEASGIVGNTQQAAAEATVAREATKVAWQEQIFTHVVIGLVLLITSYLLLTSLEWTFAWKIGVGIALIYLGGKLATVSTKLKWYWPNIIRGVGIGIIVLSLLQSGFAQLLGSGINRLEKAAAGVVTSVQPPTPAEKAAADKARREEEMHQAKVRGTEAAAYDAEAAKNMPLTEAAFTTRTAGKFEPIQIRSGTRIGPIYAYAACELRWTKTGMGMLKILTRPDSTSKPVEATLTDRGYGIKKTGHEGLVSDLFFEAVQGDIQIELVRLDNGTDKKNPCE